jgi:hypothetical protein
MSKKITLVLGGAASGKSAFAENLVISCGKSRIYLATAQCFDEEMRDKIDAEINTQYGYGSGAASKDDMDSYGVDKDTGNPGNYDQDYDMKDGGRAGYFFGGRVNFKNGGLASIL